MIKAFLRAGLVLALSLPAQAGDESCFHPGCPTAVLLTSVSAGRSYGLLIAAPDSGCRHVRFRVEGQDAHFLGHTPPLAPGELAVVHLGAGFPQGETRLTVASVGCDAPPAATLRVVLRKTAPDHGWRAERD